MGASSAHATLFKVAGNFNLVFFAQQREKRASKGKPLSHAVRIAGF